MAPERAGHPGTAAVLSFLFNGLGQIYNGQLVKGLRIVFYSVLSTGVFAIGAALLTLRFIAPAFFAHQLIIGGVVALIGLVAICAIGIFSIFDAYANGS